MRIVDVPEATLNGSVAACLRAIVEREDVPVPPADHPAPFTVWSSFLSGLGLGLVPIESPREFHWPGPWLALLGERAAVAFGSPPGLAWAPLGGTFEEVERGFVVAPADVALWDAKRRPETRTEGRVEAIAVAPRKEAPMVTVNEARAEPGRGLQGDRYFDGAGTFSNRYANGHELTLIEAEATDLAVEARRNVVTRGIDLNALVGRRFTIGEVECVGRRLCEPCAHLEKLTRPGVLRALVHIGGLRADIVAGGTIHVGDAVRPT